MKEEESLKSYEKLRHKHKWNSISSAILREEENCQLEAYNLSLVEEAEESD